MENITMAIATIGDRVNDIVAMLLPQGDGMRYVVSWQRHEGLDIPEPLAARNDVEVYRYDEPGGSRNRNNALLHCDDDDIVIIADDDLRYTADGITEVRRAFMANPELDVAIFKVEFPMPKPYPERSCRLGLPLPKGYWTTSFEIVFRMKRIGSLRFHPEMGLGAPFFGCAEDEMFLISAIKRGLNCQFIDRLICRHPQISTGHRVSPSILHGQGAIIAIQYPWSCMLRLPLKAYRLTRRKLGYFLPNLYHLIAGALRSRNLID